MKKKKETNVVLATIAIFVATFMTAIEGTIVSTAMPTIIGSLNGVSMMSWVFSIYLLTSSISTPIYGKLADRIGRKPVFLVGLVIFLIGSSMAGLSQSMLTLILSRALQGLGAGAIQPVTFTMIADIYPYEKRARVLGLNSSAWGIASIVAPLLGGYIVQHLSWHWIFFINVPVGLITMLLVIFFFQEDRRSAKEPIDLAGSATLSVLLLALMLFAQGLGGTTNPWVNALWLVLAVVAGFFFMKAERKAKDPLIPLALFKNNLFLGQNLVAALVSGVLIGFEVYIPMWMQGILGLPATMGGFAVTPSSVLWIFGSFLAGRLLVSQPATRIVSVSLFVITAGIGVLSFLPMGTSFAVFLLVAAFLGFGFGIAITTTMVTAQNVVAENEIGVASAMNTLSRTIGQTLMMSVFGIIQNTLFARGIQGHFQLKMSMLNKLINPETATQIQSNLLPQLRTILLQAMHGVYITGVILAVIAILVNFWTAHRHAGNSALK
ncbi:MDR family MFS transporter [Lapidilactobacillus achengensis]|uniref:MDR family MFS transporter n=1 Tax=Lapidilactobacillus achengensis TaxID=2486000 RepID=A0ABW1UTD2_9LACO|nr:MDR family MFS transporter [Lapidilactobacillus achengensis]